jgi:hypothetical protein
LHLLDDRVHLIELSAFTLIILGYPKTICSMPKSRHSMHYILLLTASSSEVIGQLERKKSGNKRLCEVRINWVDNLWLQSFEILKIFLYCWSRFAQYISYHPANHPHTDRTRFGNKFCRVCHGVMLRGGL